MSWSCERDVLTTCIFLLLALTGPAWGGELRESLFAVTTTPAGRLVAVGEGAVVMTSDDGGASWNRSTLDSDAWLLDVAFADAEHGWIVGQAGMAWTTADGGVSWQPAAAAEGIPEGPAPLGPTPLGSALDGRRFYDSVDLPDGRVVTVGSRGLIAVGGREPVFPAAETRTRGARFLEASRALLGARYRDNPLGEGPDGKLDQDPRIDAEHFDCVTLIEHALAVTSAGSEDVLPVLDAIRYREGQPEYGNRHHFFVADWIPHNTWLVRDVTAEIAGEAARPLRRTIGRQRFFNDQGVENADLEDETRTITVLPAADIDGVRDRLTSGLVVVLIGRRSWLFAAHTGILVRPDEGPQILMRHASFRAGRVVDEDFFGYLRRRGPSVQAIQLLEIVD